MLGKFLQNIFSTEKKYLKRYEKRANKIIELSNKYDKEETENLQEKLKEIREKIQQEKKEANIDISKIYYENDKSRYKDKVNKILDKYIDDVYAISRVLSKRILNMEHFKVQIIGGLALNDGKIAEMKTGEGKTLVATLPAILNAFFDKVYVITVNDYLVKRDANLMKPLYEACGLSVGYINPDMSAEEKKENYSKDIVYISNTEFGFDYLRNNIAQSKEEQLQPIDYYYCIIDEIDSVLIDEARTPLIISGPANKDNNLYKKANEIVKQLKLNEDFTINKEKKEILITEKGYDKIEELVGHKIFDSKIHSIDHIQNEEDILLLHYINQGIFAHYFMKNGKHYIIKDNKIYLIDEYTGRIAEGRQYSEGLHQMLEVKEGLEPSEETISYAEITYQMLFKIFVRIAGMTGTAKTEESEFYNIYGLEVITIPTNKPVIRKDLNDLFFFTKEQKYEAIVEKIKELYDKGQPVLVGTTSVEESELISQKLKKLGISHNVLNAKNHEKEAEIIARAGQEKSVTVATNMAGRGTDIKLSEKAKELGGLYVIGASRNENRRIDNQLIGRSGRQGDPGISQFYISAEDELISIFANPAFKKRLELLSKGTTKDDFIDSKFISKIINSAQEKIRKLNFEVRKNIYEYDKVFEIQRSKIYKERNKILHGLFDFENKIQEYMNNFVAYLLNKAEELVINEKKDELIAFLKGEVGDNGEAKEWFNNPENINKGAIEKPDFVSLLQYILYKEANFLVGYSFLKKELEEIYNIEVEGTFEEAIDIIEKYKDELIEFLSKLLYSYINEKFKNVDEEGKKQVLQLLLLKTLDEQWLKHINLLEIIKEGIGLRGYNQKDPLDEYKKESYHAFINMLNEIKINYIKELLNVYPEDYLLFNKEFLEEDTDILNYNLNNADIENLDNINVEEFVKKELEKFLEQGNFNEMDIVDEEEEESLEGKNILDILNDNQEKNNDKDKPLILIQSRVEPINTNEYTNRELNNIEIIEKVKKEINQ